MKKLKSTQILSADAFLVVSLMKSKIYIKKQVFNKKMTFSHLKNKKINMVDISSKKFQESQRLQMKLSLKNFFKKNH